MARKEFVKAVAYLRTSSATNVGADKDSGKRQSAAIAAFAKAAGYEVVDSYNDEAVSGADHVTARPGFAAMMERIAGNGVRTIIVETANRFARDLIVQETGYAMLKGSGVELSRADAVVADHRDGKIVRLGYYNDRDQALEAAGLEE